jgi:alpha-D-xyloside xylohydrolase
MWISPMVQSICGRDIYPIGRIGSGYLQALDLTDPAVTATFEQRIEGLLATGVDGFKVDRGDEVDLEGLTLAGGSGSDIHNEYPVLVAKAIDDASVAVRGKLLPTLFRAGFMGSQSLVTGTWSGDLPGTWDGLADAVRSAQTAGLAGFSTWGSDIGGYESPDLTPDVFVRWAQLGAISPVFEVGGTGANARPWELGAPAMEGLRDAAVLHQELFPDLYRLARGASRTGVPVLRPLGLEYPSDAHAWAAAEELLVGPDLLAAPVTGQGTTPSVYLPAGVWNDLSTGARVAGPKTFTRPTPLGQLPLYLRSGTAIPYNLRTPDIWRSPWGASDLFRDGRGGWLLAPGAKAAGDSAEYGSIRSVTTGRRISLLLTRARLETEVLVLDRRVPARVLIDGRPVKRSSSLASLRAARQGWLPNAGATHGVVLKLAPRSGRSIVELGY